MRDSNKVAMIMLILFLTLVFVPSVEDERESGSKYLSIDKEEYEVGENVTIHMVNDGNATNYPIRSDLRIKNADTGRIVYSGPELVQPAIPPKGYTLRHQCLLHTVLSLPLVVFFYHLFL